MNQQQWHNRFSGQAQLNWASYQSGYQNQGMLGQLEAVYQATRRDYGSWQQAAAVAASTRASLVFGQQTLRSEYLSARFARDCAPAELIAASDLEF